MEQATIGCGGWLARLNPVLILVRHTAPIIREYQMAGTIGIAGTADAGQRGSSRALYVATILTGSFLLFLIQPMIARIALPRFGGAPAVWNSAMLVYQALLLAGYAYAHAIGRLAPRAQGGAQVAVLAAATLCLPVGLVATTPPADASPVLWVPWLLLVSIGPIFFAVAAQAPLVQRWFAHDAPSANPYQLYAASNLGSFGGLLAYPFLLEPLVDVEGQRRAWSAGYVVLVLLMAACAFRLPAQDRARAVPVATRSEAMPGARQWAFWIVGAAVPSGLVLSTTTHLTTDLVAMPLLWVIPLGLYLLSFSVAFTDTGRIAHLCTRAAPALLVLGAMIALSSPVKGALAVAAFGLLLLFVVATALHHRLYLARPAAAQLTRFYLATSIGGMLGGLFCALVAPVMFNGVYEHPFLLLGAALLLYQTPLPTPARLLASPRGRRIAPWLPIVAIALSLLGGDLAGPSPEGLKIAIGVVIGAMALAAIGRPRLFAGCIAALIMTFGGWNAVASAFGGSEARTRSFFGVYGVSIDSLKNARILAHGTTVHGIQRLAPGHEADPTSYYIQRSGVGRAMLAAPALFGAQARIGVVGLGAGTLACYARPGQSWRFYEIDPAVAEIARDRARFSFLARCLPDAVVRIGDARLELARDPQSSLDLLVVDAFSSDAVPMHLLTREALGVYDRVLAARGLLMIHISNRFVDLEPVLAAGATFGGWQARVLEHAASKAELAASGTPSVWVALSRDPRTIDRLVRAGGEWRPLRGRPGMRPWTDDHASILPILKLE